MSWSSKLLDSLKDPLLHVMTNERLVAIKDKFPKARIHFLVMPKEQISTIFELKKSHLDLLDDMYLMAERLIEKQQMSKASFKIGFHAIPSMQQVHLHVISRDFDSEALKTKKHWNSFNTEYFVKFHDLRSELEKTGKINRISEIRAKELLSMPLKCNSCDFQPKNIPNLKQHLLSHVDLYSS
ncbi:aprataxin [Culicoides brevitarsis]|uniref:aprataxin n=1 Tax=Culicoides brevitarsis TaxID=469753 RepID=UPI00307C632D